MNIIELLLKQGIISSSQLDKVKEEVKRTGMTLEKAVEKLGYATEVEIIKVKANSLGVPYLDLANYIADGSLIKLIQEKDARKYKILPLFKVGNKVTLGMVNPEDIIAQDVFRRTSGIDIVETVLVTEKGLQKALDTYYGLSGSLDEIINNIDQEKFSAEKDLNLVEVAEEAPIIKLVNMMFMQAIKERASDIHIEPEENSLIVRNRIDGVLHETYTLPT